jgi:hypothetical protein
VTEAPKIAVEATYSKEQLSLPRDLALEAGKTMYDCFGWNPTDDQIRADQEQLYVMQMGRG